MWLHPEAVAENPLHPSRSPMAKRRQRRWPGGPEKGQKPIANPGLRPVRYNKL